MYTNIEFRNGVQVSAVNYATKKEALKSADCATVAGTCIQTYSGAEFDRNSHMTKGELVSTKGDPAHLSA